MDIAYFRRFIINSKKSKFIPNIIKSTNEICTKRVWYEKRRDFT